MTSLNKQVISAGAEMCGSFIELIIEASQIRQNMREASEKAAETQAESAKADGITQQTALQQEAKMRGNSATESIFDAAGQGGGEALGFAAESVNSARPDVRRAQSNVDALKQWETKLDKMQEGHLFIGNKKLDADRSGLTLTPKEAETIDPNILHPKTSGRVVDPDTYFKSNGADRDVFERAVATNDKSLISFKKELRRQLKEAKSVSEQKSNAMQSWSQRLKVVGQVTGPVGRAIYETQNKTLQMMEAEQKLSEANMKFSSDISGSTTRIANSTADTSSSWIHDLEQSMEKMRMANDARA